MKQCFLAIFILTFSSFAAGAQTVETVNELTHMPSNVGKFAKRLSPNRRRWIREDDLEFKMLMEPVNLSGNKKALLLQ